MTPKIRFGVHTPPQNVAWQEIRDLWRLIDTLGYDTAWTFDHFYPIFADPAGPCLEGWMLLAALAAETSHVRLGTLVTGNTYRHPAVLANMAATLDHTSGGRLILGIGAAWFDMEHHAYGILYPPVGERIARLDEACYVIRSLWTIPETNLEGRFYTMKAARCEPKPLQKPHPPIMIGGGGEKKTLRVVARHADMWNWFGSVDTFRHKIEILRGHCVDVSRDPNKIELSWAGDMKITSSASEKRDFLESKSKQRGQPASEVEALSLIGSPEEIATRICEYSGIGIRHFIVSASAPHDHTSIRRFAEEVIPKFR